MSHAAPTSGPLTPPAASAPPASRPTPESAAGARSLLHPGREPAFLDLDFQETPRPELITRLLAVAAATDDDALWQLSVATRLKRLLRLVRDTEAISTLPLRLRCPHAACGQFLEIELPLADLDALHDEAADRDLLRFPGADSRPLAFRRPTGDDLRRWRTAPPSQETVLRTLLVPETPAPEPLSLPAPETCAAAFSEFDSLVAFQLMTACPHCGRESTHAIDLETLALNRLAALQQRLFHENHRLAAAYGWSETDILAVPRRRRLRYLATLEDTA